MPTRTWLERSHCQTTTGCETIPLTSRAALTRDLTGSIAKLIRAPCSGLCDRQCSNNPGRDGLEQLRVGAARGHVFHVPPEYAFYFAPLGSLRWNSSAKFRLVSGVWNSK